MGNNPWSKTDYKVNCFDLHINLDHGHCTPLTKKLCLSKVLAKQGLQGEYVYA